MQEMPFDLDKICKKLTYYDNLCSEANVPYPVQVWFRCDDANDSISWMTEKSNKSQSIVLILRFLTHHEYSYQMADGTIENKSTKLKVEGKRE